MAFTLTGLPRFYNLTKTAWDAGVDAGKIEAGAVYFVTDGTETTLYVGKADNAFLTITDPTVASQITAAIEAITAADIEFSDSYKGDYANVEAAIEAIEAVIDALGGDVGDFSELVGRIAALEQAVAALQTGKMNKLEAVASDEILVGGTTALDVKSSGKKLADLAEKVHTHVMADITDSDWVKGAAQLTTADEIVAVSAAGSVKQTGVKVADLVKSADFDTYKNNLTIAGMSDYKASVQDKLDAKADSSNVYTIANADAKFETITGAAGKYAEIGAAYTKGEADDKFALITDAYTKAEAEAQVALLATKQELAADKAELKGNIDKKVDQTAYDTQVALLATKEELSGAKTELEGKITTLTGDVYSKTEADGKFATIADYSTTVVMNQAIADAKAAVIGTAEDGASVDTVKGAKAYADSLITGLGAVFEFKGVVANYAALTALTGMEKGDVYLVTSDENQAGTPANAEYVYDGAKWELLGNTALDTTNFVQSTVELTSDKVVLGNGGKGVKASAYGIGGETAEAFGAGNANTLATEAALAEILEVMCWKETM